MKMLLHIFLFWICATFVTTFACPNNCDCFLNTKGIEYVCPKNVENPDFDVHVTDHTVDIDCSSNRTDLEPPEGLNLGNRERFTIRFCPLPTNFSGYVHTFGVNTISVLSFSHSDFANTTLSRKLFSGLDSLTHLVIQNSKLEHLDEDVFVDMPALRQIKLQENDISVLPPRVFSYTANLEVLDLSMNKIAEFPVTIFKGLEKLEILSLFQNQLKALEDGVFEGLSHVTSLDLSFNKLTNLPESVFRPLANLKQLNLDGNELKVLPSGIFSQNFNLDVVRLNRNPGLSLADELLADLNVTKVYLTQNALTSIPSNVFSKSYKIQELWLQANALQNLPKTVFSNLTSLKVLNLQSNKLENVDGIFDTLTSLTDLDISNNEINHIDKDTFGKLRNLKKLDFSRNKLASLELLTLISNEKLKIINGSFNELSFEEEAQFLPFNFCLNVEYLILHHNHIKELHTDFIANKHNLQELDLSYNQINELPVSVITDLFQKKSVVNLSHNNISFIDFTDVEIISSANNYYLMGNDQKTVVNISYNPIDCGCAAYDLLRYKSRLMDRNIYAAVEFPMANVNCVSPTALHDVLLSSLHIETWTCPLVQPCADDCTCEYRPYDIALVVHCDNRNLTIQPSFQLPGVDEVIYNHTEMHLEYNNLKSFTNFGLDSYSNVTELYLSHNHIQDVTWFPPQLKVLKLDNNYLGGLNYTLLRTLNTSALFHLTLHNNPWVCNCEATNLARFLREHVKQEKYFMIDVTNIKCKDTGKKLVDLTEKDLCYTYTVPILVISIVVTAFLLLLALAAALFYKYTQEIKVWLFAHKMLLWWVTEEDLDKDKRYDAFLCFSHKDDDFVLQELVPVLERQSYKLCIHYRDWTAGELIINQVSDSVTNSKRTIIVVSRNFMESVWGMVEFRIAHKQSIVDGLARVILILYGDIDVDKDLDDELRAYIATNTYVKWGDPYFWNKIKYALPHSQDHIKVKMPKCQKHANVMKSLEDKFSLDQMSPEICSANLAFEKDNDNKADESPVNSTSFIQSSEGGLSPLIP